MLCGGHGAIDPGAIGPTGLREKDINLAVTKKIARILANSVDVVLTRTMDVNPELHERVAVANNLRADCYVSIHCNGHNNPAANGTETYYYDENTRRSTQSRTLATCIQHRLKRLGRVDRGVKHGNFHVLRETHIPAALVEIAFITNPEEESLLASEVFLDEAAMNIAQGIADFLGLTIYQGPSINLQGKIYQGRMIDGVMHMPVRGPMEQEGYTVHWDSEWQTCHVYKKEASK